MNGSDPWYLRLEGVASPMTPRQAALNLQSIADRLGIAVEGEINEELWRAIPGADEPYRLEPSFMKLSEKDAEPRGPLP